MCAAEWGRIYTMDALVSAWGKKKNPIFRCFVASASRLRTRANVLWENLRFTRRTPHDAASTRRVY